MFSNLKRHRCVGRERAMQIQQPGPISQAKPLEGPEGSDYTPPLMEPEPQSDELYVSQPSEV